MAADVVTIAKQVTAAVNAMLPELGFSGTTAVRKNKPKYSLEDLAKLCVTVSPVMRTAEYLAKGGLLDTRPRVDVDIRQRTGDNQDREDALIELSEVIAERFLAGVEGVVNCLEVETSAVFQTDEMIEKGLFAVAVALTFSVARVAR